MLNSQLEEVFLCRNIKIKMMAMEIKAPPVLEGKAAREFYKRWAEANAKLDISKEEAQASMRKTLAILEKFNKSNQR